MTALIETTSDLILAPDFTAEERTTLSALLTPGASVDIVVPEDTPPEELLHKLDVLLKTHGRLREAQSKIKPLIGRVLVVLQKHPETWERRGFRSWNDFITRGLPADLGISRAELYHAKAIAETLPQLSLDQAQRIGSSKLAVVAQAVKTQPDKQDQWLERAEQTDLRTLRNEVAEAKHCDPDDLEMTALTLIVSRSVKQRLEEFLANPLVHAYVESSSPSAILDRIIQEVELEWFVRGREAQQG